MRFILSLFLLFVFSLSMPAMADNEDKIKKLEEELGSVEPGSNWQLTIDNNNKIKKLEAELQLVLPSLDCQLIIKTSDKLLDIQPDHPVANLEKGKSLIELGKYHEAQEALKKVYHFFDVGIRYRYEHEFDAIIRAQGLYYEGKCLEHLGDLEFAKIYYSSAITDGYDNPEVQADLERVTKKYNEQLPKDPYSVKIRELEKKLSYASLERLKWKKIVSAADELLALEPQHPMAHYKKAWALMRSKNGYEEAIKSFNKAIKYHHQEKRFKEMIIRESFYHRGQCLRALGRLEEALESFDLAIMHGLDHRYIYFQRDEVIMELGLEID